MIQIDLLAGTDEFQNFENESIKILLIGTNKGLGTLFGRSILTKNGRMVILRGTWHTGPAYFYKDVQRDIDLAKNLGFIIFREGYNVKGVEVTDLGPRQLLIFYFLEKVLSKFYEVMAKVENCYEEHEILDFPLETIRVDMNEEIIDHLKNYGFALYWPLFIALHISLLINWYIPNFSWFSCFLFKLITDKGIHVFLDRRDELVFRVAESSSYKKIYVHYGDSHVQTMRNRLVQNGWKPVLESDFIEYPEPFNLKKLKSKLEKIKILIIKRIEAFSLYI